MGFKGSVESFSLADVFQNLSMNQQTGTLKVVADNGDEKHVYFDVGHVKRMAKGPRKPLLLPDVFIAHGLVLKMQLEPALERAQANAEFIGPVLIELGHISELQLTQLFKHQIEEEIFDLFSWEKANFEFNEGPSAEGMFLDQLSIQLTSLPISHLIMEAARRVDEWERFKVLIPDTKIIYTMDLPIRKAIEKGEMEVDSIEKRIAMLIDGERDIDDLIEDSFLFKFEVMTALSSFLQSSLIHTTTLQELLLTERENLKFAPAPRRIKVLERILLLGGENEIIRRNLADLLASESRIDSACFHYNTLATLQHQQGHEEEALEIYRRVLEISPKNAKTHEHLGDLYISRGHRREAFVHYQELFETLRDQNENKEAIVAGEKALQCDLTQNELRSNLIDLLLASQQKDIAAQHLGMLGDQAAKIGNVKLAADSYRRAMMYLPSDNQLRKKLSDVMLTKEDRVTRKRRIMVAAIAFLFICVVSGIFALIEYLNSSDFSRAHQTAQDYLREGLLLEESENYEGAVTRYRSAQEVLRPITHKFSPILNYKKKANVQIAALDSIIAEAVIKNDTHRASDEKRSRVDLANAETQFKAFHLYEARESFEKVIANPLSTEENRKKSTTQLEELQKLILKLEEDRKRFSRKPSEAFTSPEEESGFKRAFLLQFGKNPKLVESIDIQIPLWIKPETDLVNVFLNGRLVGTLGRSADRELNTFRYPLTGTNRFEFKKEGYLPVTLNVSESQTATYVLKMDRAVSYTFDMSTLLGAEVSLSGEGHIEGDALYTGTTEGSLLEISLSEKKIIRRYDLPGGIGLNTEVLGPITFLKRTDKPPLILYCTKAGDCIALAPIEKGFQEVWPPIRGKAAQPLTAAPSVVKLPILSRAAILLVPLDKKLLLIDAESGTTAKPIEFKSTITSTPSAISGSGEQGALIVAGCIDGNIYGYSSNGDLLREWNTNARATAVRGKPFVYEDLMMAGADDGALYFFDLKKSGFGVPIPLEGEIVMEPLLLKKRLYVGATRQAGFWAIDMGVRKPNWQKIDRDMGGVALPPAWLDNQLYFVTDKGNIFSLDLDKGLTLWSYHVEGSRGFSASPKVIGKRVYFISKNGKILGFDEQIR